MSIENNIDKQIREIIRNRINYNNQQIIDLTKGMNKKSIQYFTIYSYYKNKNFNLNMVERSFNIGEIGLRNVNIIDIRKTLVSQRDIVKFYCTNSDHTTSLKNIAIVENDRPLFLDIINEIFEKQKQKA